MLSLVETPPSPLEVDACSAAYSGPPWNEHMTYAEADEYARRFRTLGHIVLAARQEEVKAAEPYLYVYISTYDDLPALMNDEFTGSGAFYAAVEPSVIRQALEPYGDTAFISSVHADRTVALPPSLKPRLQVLPKLFEQIFALTGTSCIAYYTHRETAMSDASTPEKLPGLGVTIVPYNAQPQHGGEATELLLVIVTKQASPQAED